MNFTIHYCDGCGERIREEALRTGAAIQFSGKCYCKECQEPLLSDSGFQRFLKESRGGCAPAAVEVVRKRKARRKRKTPSQFKARTAGARRSHAALQSKPMLAVFGGLLVGATLLGLVLLLL